MKRNYLGLDLIRFVAAMMVMIYHLAFFDWLSLQADQAGRYQTAFHPLAPLAAAGWVGVSIFFMLSGFVIAQSANGRRWDQFVGGRISRLYPAAWIGSSISAAILIHMGHSGVAPLYIRSMTLFPLGPWVSGVYWTLAAEIVFYALMALMLALRLKDAPVKLGYLLAAASTIFYALRVANMLLRGGGGGAFDFFDTPAGTLLLLSNGCYFAVGIALWALRERKPTVGTIAMFVIATGTSFVAIVASAKFRASAPGYPHSQLVVVPLTWALGLGAIILSIHWKDSIARAFGAHAKAFHIAGLITYPLYLMHDVIGAAMMQALRISPALSLLAAMSAALAISYLVVELERYPRALLSRALNMGRPAPAAEGVAQLP